MKYYELVEGYPLVAKCDIKGRDYSYALYDTNAKIGDMVMVTGACHSTPLEITDILKVEDADTSYVTECVVGIVDTSAYDKFAKNKEKIDKLRAKMEERKRIIEARKNDDFYAAQDDEYKNLLAEYRNLM